MTYPEIQTAIKVASLEPSRQSLDHILDIVSALNDEVHRLRLEVGEMKLRDAPFKNTFNNRNGSMPSTVKKQGSKLMSTKIRGEGVSGSAVGPATSADKVA